MNQHKMAVIKEEFDDNLITPLEGWNAVTGDIIPPVINSTPPLSTTTTQFVSNQPSPPATTSNHPSTSTSLPSHVKQTYPNVASVRVMPPYARQGLVKIVERTDNNRPFIAARTNKFVPIGSNVPQTNTALPFEFLLKQTQEQLKEMTTKLVDNRNAYSLLEKKYDDLKLENEKQHDEIKQLKNVLQWYHQVTILTQNNAQTPPETSQSTAQLYSNEETVNDISTRPDLLNNLIQVGKNLDSEHCPSPSNATEMQIKQQLSNDDSVSNQAVDILSSDQLNLNNNSVFQCITTVNEHALPSAIKQIDVINKLTHESGHHEVIGANIDQQCTQMLQSNDSQENMNKVLNGENGLVNQNEQNTGSSDEEEMSHNEHSVVESNEPSTGAQQQSKRIVSTQPITDSIGQNPTKRKQSQSNCSVKSSKKTVEDGEEEEGQQADQMEAQPIEMNYQDKQYITLSVRCLQAECPQVFVQNEAHQAVHQLNYHLQTVHSIGHIRCVLKDCAQSFYNNYHLSRHIKQIHGHITDWKCAKCLSSYTSYPRLSLHNYKQHHLGQFQCSFPGCAYTGDHRNKIHNHYSGHHRHPPRRHPPHRPPHRHVRPPPPPAKRELICCQSGCGRLFTNVPMLKIHQRTHLGTVPYRCKWPNCEYLGNTRSHTILHIRRDHLKPNAHPNVSESDFNDPKDHYEVAQDLM